LALDHAQLNLIRPNVSRQVVVGKGYRHFTTRRKLARESHPVAVIKQIFAAMFPNPLDPSKVKVGLSEFSANTFTDGVNSFVETSIIPDDRDGRSAITNVPVIFRSSLPSDVRRSMVS
jgi:hypothetical protein